MEDSDERVIAALAIDVYFAANVVVMFMLPILLGNYMYEHGNGHGYGVGILSSIAWWDTCTDIYRLWTYCILALPLYAVIQAAPKGAFSLKEEIQ